jgi:hypothetical protein
VIGILVGAIIVAALVACLAWATSSRLRYHAETPKHSMHAKVTRDYPQDGSGHP